MTSLHDQTRTCKVGPHHLHQLKLSLQGVVMTVDSCTTKDGDEVPALVLKALRQANQKVEGTVTSHQQLIEVLGEHRRPLGIGVHGPLQAKGRMFLVIVPEEGDRLRVSMSMQPTEVTGPRGSWTARD